jgi:hypothetical protein
VDCVVDPLPLLRTCRLLDTSTKLQSNDAWWWRHWCGWTKEAWPWSLYSWWHHGTWLVQVTFTTNWYLHCLLHLTTSFLPSRKDSRLFLMSTSRHPMHFTCFVFYFL